MQPVAATLEELMLSIKSQNMASSFDRAEYEKRRIDNFNEVPGTLTGLDCTECLNRGHSAVLGRGGVMVVRDCKCMTARRTLQRIERSGLKDIIEDCTFDSFLTPKGWQVQAKQTARDFLQNCHGSWFYAGGQVGSGKTHLCAAIVGELLKQGKAARYMLWRDEIVSIKAIVNDEDRYSRRMDELKRVEVLYIDDFFKTERGKVPTTGDINVAFELLNYRYNNKSLVTIISCESLIDELLEIDEAVGSRIYHRSRCYCLAIGKDQEKNYRLCGGGKGV